MHNYGRGLHLSIRCIESIQTLEETYRKDGQELRDTLSAAKTTLNGRIQQKKFQIREAFVQRISAWYQCT